MERDVLEVKHMQIGMIGILLAAIFMVVSIKGTINSKQEIRSNVAHSYNLVDDTITTNNVVAVSDGSITYTFSSYALDYADLNSNTVTMSYVMFIFSIVSFGLYSKFEKFFLRLQYRLK